MTELDPYRPGQVDETGRPLCGAKLTSKAKYGKPCGQSPEKGAPRCWRHGGKAKQVRAKAKRNVANQKAEKVMRSLGYDPQAENVDPSEALLRLVSDKAREVAWLRHMVDQVQAAEDDADSPLVWGRASHEEGVGPMGPINKDDYKADLNVWVKWLHQAEDQLARYATAALRAGVEQRQVEIREAEALVFVGALHQILANLQLTADQQRLVPTIVPAALRAIETGTAA